MSARSGTPFDRIPGLLRPWAPVTGSTYQWTISIITIDAAGAILPNCEVHLFHADTDIREAIGTSDSNGALSFHPGTNSGFFYAVAFSQDGTKKGATTKTLTAV